MPQITVDIPEEVCSALAELGPVEPWWGDVSRDLLVLTVVKLYEMGHFSSGAAAHLLGLPRTVFLQRVGELGVPVFSRTRDELVQDAANAFDARDGG